MPMIDVFVPTGLLPAGSRGPLGQELALAVLRAEGVPPESAAHRANTAAWIHELPPAAISTAAEIAAEFAALAAG
jgi:hypothetical protein